MAAWIIVVDDDTANLNMAGHILSKNNFRVTAMKSGNALIDYIKKNGSPDLILLDIMMPKPDGFETLEMLRRYEQETGKEEVPVIFLTADEDSSTETRGFEAGVSDFVRKPFDPDVLLRRINNTLSKQEKMLSFKAEATTDKLTGFLNKGAAQSLFPDLCKTETGCLMMIDLDSFKLVNDIYGHEMGDEVLISCARIISENVPSGSKCARMGGDEFAAFCKGMTSEDEIKTLAENVNLQMQADAKRLMGDDMDIPLGASIGAVFVPNQGNDYESLIKLADKSLYIVKKNGKHGYAVYNDSVADDDNELTETDIHTVSTILGERSIPNSALELDKEVFTYVYRYIMRYIIRNRKTACRVQFSLAPSDGNEDPGFRTLCDKFGSHLKETLRKSDIFMRSRSNRYFVLLTDIQKEYVGKVIGDLINHWEEQNGKGLAVTYETDFAGDSGEYKKAVQEVRVAVVDDDPVNLQTLGMALSKNGYFVTALKSGQALLDYLEHNTPTLILLDVKMPSLDGFETMKAMKKMSRNTTDIPVIFLTADDSTETEKTGLALGAMDFIRKPVVQEVLLLRVRHIIELVTLQRSLKSEVEKKTNEISDLFIHLVQSLADAIDAKDTYTNGHSSRVAAYSKEIARRAGYSEQHLNDIYMMGLLHDVGKIGVPDEIINKPSRLTAEEYEKIKTHTVLGAKILENIKVMPQLATGARWHHERYGGGGYPDGITSESIPEEARIIAVADAYDAMTSKRSYRDALTQEYVRSEIEKGKGTQFDPKFADIMLEMIDEDPDYLMREK